MPLKSTPKLQFLQKMNFVSAKLENKYENFASFFKTPLIRSNYSAVMNDEYQEFINVTLWLKGSK